MLKSSRFLSLAALCLLLTSCAGDQAAKQGDAFFLKPSSFAALPGWQADDQGAALAPLRKSCARMAKQKGDKSFALGGTAADWQTACLKLPASDAGAKSYFEQNFTPYEIYGSNGRNGLFTGYYEPMLTGTTTAGVPLYATPKDMIAVNLGDFKESLKGQTVTGRVAGGKLVPYYDRAAIEAGAIKSSAQELARVTDPVDAFFLQIQGSGQVRMPDGSIRHLGYASQNGQPYTAIGKELLDRGALSKEDVSMQSIRAWLASHPAEAQGVMNLNKSYVFFQELDGQGPRGAEGVTLTPGRSLAVDHKKIPYGTPVFVDAENADKQGRFQRLMIAQDTGGAITGAVRGDVFWGAGDEAVQNAGIMKSAGQSYLLLPKQLQVSPAFLR